MIDENQPLKKGERTVAVLRFPVPSEWDGKPLGQLLRTVYGVSGTTLKKAKRIDGGITQDGMHIRTVDPVRAGAEIRVAVDAEKRVYQPVSAEVPVLFEDESFVAFDKPAGLVVHPSRGHPYDTLANVYAGRPETAGLVFRPLDRLDRDTTGIVLAAKNAHVATNTVLTKKRYAAILAGVPEEAEFVIDAPIAREGKDTQKRCIRPDGQAARTRCRVIKTENGFALAAFALETGRTHQIRVHAASIGCPLLGDPLYGTSSELIGRQALHCALLAFRHPMTGEELTLFSPIPDDFAKAAAALGFGGVRALLEGNNML